MNQSYAMLQNMNQSYAMLQKNEPILCYVTKHEPILCYVTKHQPIICYVTKMQTAQQLRLCWHWSCNVGMNAWGRTTTNQSFTAFHLTENIRTIRLEPGLLGRTHSLQCENLHRTTLEHDRKRTTKEILMVEQERVWYIAHLRIKTHQHLWVNPYHTWQADWYNRPVLERYERCSTHTDKNVNITIRIVPHPFVEWLKTKH